MPLSRAKWALCCCLGRICHPSPAVMTLEGQRLLARGKSFCRAGEIDGPNPISSLDQAATSLHSKTLGTHPRHLHAPSIFHLSRTMDQESKLLAAPHCANRLHSLAPRNGGIGSPKAEPSLSNGHTRGWNASAAR